MNGGFAQAVRARRIEALARRAAMQDGAVRALLDARLDSLRQAQADAPAPTAPAAAAPAAPLQALLAHIAERTAAPEDTLTATTPRQPAAPRELRAVRAYRSTWSRLSVEQRIHQALAQVPPQAGPLNTQRLVHEALRTLRDVAPAYLHRVVAQVETLLWLEQLGEAGPAARKGGARINKP